MVAQECRSVNDDAVSIARVITRGHRYDIPLSDPCRVFPSQTVHDVEVYTKGKLSLSEERAQPRKNNLKRNELSTVCNGRYGHELSSNRDNM